MQNLNFCELSVNKADQSPTKAQYETKLVKPLFFQWLPGGMLAQILSTYYTKVRLQ